MAMMSRQEVRHKGFTLIELLVVIAIITLLLGILSPGIRAMAAHAKGLKQKSQMNSIKIGLEFFEKRYDILPDSKALPDTGSSQIVTGAHHLAEALLGRDERGFDPKSLWHDGDESATAIDDLYRNDEATPEGRKSLNRRLGPFMEIQDSGAFTIDELYGPAAAATAIPAGIHSENEVWDRAPVITDIYGLTKIVLANGEKVKVGSPVLYYKAKTSSRLHEADKSDYAGIDKFIYNFSDNLAITGDQADAGFPGLPCLKDESEDKVLTITKFYDMITNHKASYEKPYNSDSYLLISAGWDGVYGTKDDITNFDY